MFLLIVLAIVVAACFFPRPPKMPYAVTVVGLVSASAAATLAKYIGPKT